MNFVISTYTSNKTTPAMHSIYTRLSSQLYAGTPTIKLILSLTKSLSNKSRTTQASSMYKDLCTKYNRPLPTLAISLSYAYDPYKHPGWIISILNDTNQFPLLTIANKLWLHRAQTQQLARLCLEQEAHLTKQNTHIKKNPTPVSSFPFGTQRTQ